MRLVGAQLRTERWSLDGTGAARGRTERTALLLEATIDSGATGTGEAAPLPGLSSDSLDEARAALETLVDALARAPIELRAGRIGAGAATSATAADADADAATCSPPDSTLLASAAQLARTFAPHSPAARFAFETAVLAACTAPVGAPLVALLPALPAQTLSPSVVVDDADAAARAFAGGARFLKVKVGTALDRERVEAIARAAPGARLRLDANRSWPRDLACGHLAALADLPIDYVEEPCADAHELLAAPLAIPIALDESLPALSHAALSRALTSPDLAALVLKPTLLGGIAACLELARVAAAHAKAVIVTHALESPVGRAASDALGGNGACPRSHSTIRDRDRPHFYSTRRAATVVAHPTRDTVDAIERAFTERTPLALLHARTTDAELSRQRALVDTAELSGNDAVILFTSGSTGMPRGVVLTRAAIDAAVAASATHLGWRDDDRWLLALSTAHAGGLAVVARCHAAGRSIVLAEREGDRTALVRALADSTVASLVPTQLAMLLDDPAWRPPRALRTVLLGGAAAPRALLEAAAARGVPFLTTYGLTETFGQIATAPLDRAGDPDAPLVPLAGVELDAGTRAAPAPIVIRGPMLAARYLDGAPIAPAFTTADLGFLEDGALHVVGRADRVIITGGENVHPSEVETALTATPGVRMACVFGVPDTRWGQIVVAAIAVDATYAREHALDAWAATLPAHQRPRELAVVDALPTLPSGKLDYVRAAALVRAPVRYRPA